MKKLYITVLSQMIAVLCFSQQSFSVVSVNREVQGSDTLRTFYVEGSYPAVLISKLNQKLGTPKGENTGELSWSGVNVPGIGQNLSLELRDGVMVYDASGTSAVFTPVTDKADLEAKLYHDPSRLRRLMIQVKKGSANKVDTHQAEMSARAYLEDVLLN